MVAPWVVFSNQLRDAVKLLYMYICIIIMIIIIII